MNTTATDEVVLKQDVLGRVKTPKARREQLLDEFERSGLPGQRFVELAGIKYQTFATWVQKRRRQRGDYAAGTFDNLNFKPAGHFLIQLDEEIGAEFQIKRSDTKLTASVNTLEA
jgi:hypothetical protein